jgi:hypothetical protein
MQAWEYARLVINWVDVNYTICKFALFLPDGRREEASDVKVESWKFFDKKIADLGQEGWELVSVAPFAGGLGTANTSSWHLWFKRPTQG